MIFQHTWQQVLDGSKTQTRRIKQWHHIADGDYAHCSEVDGICYYSYDKKAPAPIDPIYHMKCDYVYMDGCAGKLKTIQSVWIDGGRLLWHVGKTYAVQPGRGKKAIARIRLTAIRQEHVQDISWRDGLKEGLQSWYGLGKPPLGCFQDYHSWEHPEEFIITYQPKNIITAYAELWDSINTKPGTRWEDNPLVWVLEFELVKSAEAEWGGKVC
jgi:hypothetical protein